MPFSCPGRAVPAYFSVAVSLCFAPPAHAASEPGDSLDAVVVTATRSEQPRALTGESITVYTAADLARLQSVALTDVLQLTPGVAVARNGGPGQPSALGLRGALAGQTLLLIDGVRLNDPGATDGAVVLSDVLVNHLERVEVLRGPQSTLYGSDAIGGVVNLISARGALSPFDGGALLEGGSLGSWRANLSARGTAGTLDYGVAVNALRSDGISAADVRDGNRERDAFRHDGATANLRWHVTDTLSFDARAYATDSRVDFDGFPPPDYRFRDTPEYGENRLLAAYVAANLDLADGRFRQRVAYLGTASDRTLFDPAQAVTETFVARGHARRFEYQGTVDLSDHDQLNVGAETQQTSLHTASPSVFEPRPVPTLGDSRIDSYYAQLQSTLREQLTLTGGLRRDENAGFGSHTSLKLAVAWQLRATGTVLRANFGDGFKAPSLYELYSEYSNPVRQLAPESARGWEAGIDQRLLQGRALLSATGFERRTKDQIDFFSCFGVETTACTTRPFGYYDNIARSRSRGLELEGSVQATARLSIAANATLLRATDVLTGRDLARRPRRMANLRVEDQVTERWQLGAAWRYVGPRFDDAFASQPLPGYALVDLHTSWQVAPRLELLGRIENALDRRYSPVAGYGAPPRTGTLGLRWVPAP
jgi:vitamin B12 transporter